MGGSDSPLSWTYADDHSFPDLDWVPSVVDDMTFIETPNGGWLVAEMPLLAWAFIDLLRLASGRPTRSVVAEELLRRALAIDDEVEE
jgi:hypothetical protein